MATKFLSTFLSILFFVCNGASQTADSSSVAVDTPRTQIIFLDSNTVQEYFQQGKQNSFLANETKDILYDVQQTHSSNKSSMIFFLLLMLLVLITYVKVVFSKDITELLLSVVNPNIAQQIFRARLNEISFSSFLLHLNFIIALSLYVQFILGNYFHIISPENFSSIPMLIFLFTFFYMIKIALIKVIGIVFEVNEECREYIYNLLTVCKTVGLTLIPALFIFHTTSKIFFNPVFVSSLLFFGALIIIFIWRGLSTGYKLLYRSMYHFFIYVCVVEISTIFLLFKLLTKTIH